MSLNELKAYLKGFAKGIGDRALTQEEWQEILEMIEKNQEYNYQRSSNLLPNPIPYNPLIGSNISNNKARLTD